MCGIVLGSLCYEGEKQTKRKEKTRLLLRLAKANIGRGERGEGSSHTRTCSRPIATAMFRAGVIKTYSTRFAQSCAMEMDGLWRFLWCRLTSSCASWIRAHSSRAPFVYSSTRVQYQHLCRYCTRTSNLPVCFAVKKKVGG